MKLAIDGEWYDLTKWAPYHPGGEAGRVEEREGRDRGWERVDVCVCADFLSVPCLHTHTHTLSLSPFPLFFLSLPPPSLSLTQLTRTHTRTHRGVGARILERFDGHNATEHFYSLHSAQAVEQFKRMRPVEAKEPVPEESKIDIGEPPRAHDFRMLFTSLVLHIRLTPSLSPPSLSPHSLPPSCSFFVLLLPATTTPLPFSSIP